MLESIFEFFKELLLMVFGEAASNILFGFLLGIFKIFQFLGAIVMFLICFGRFPFKNWIKDEYDSKLSGLVGFILVLVVFTKIIA